MAFCLQRGLIYDLIYDLGYDLGYDLISKIVDRLLDCSKTSQMAFCFNVI
jgi:hypothetical protein